jgi:hypothetical protein
VQWAKQLFETKSIDRLDKTAILTKIATFYFLLSFFCIRITYQGNYDNDIPLKFYILEPFVIFILYLIKFKNLPYSVQKKQLKYFLAIVLLFCVIEIFQLQIHRDLILQNGDLPIYIVRFFWRFLDLFSVFIFAFYLFDTDLFVNYFRKFSIFTFFCLLICFPFYEITGIPLTIVVDVYNRAQAFMSEPSALAPVLGASLLIFINKKEKTLLFLTVISIFLVKSSIAYIVITLSLLSIYFITLSKVKKLVLISSLFVGSFVFWDIDLRDTSKNYINTPNAFTSSFGKLMLGIENIKHHTIDYNNTRYNLANFEVNEIIKNKLWAIGLGLGSSEVYMVKQYGAEMDVNLPLNLIVYYGFLGLLLFLTINYAIIQLYKNNLQLFLILLPFLFTSLINCAEGFETYKFLFLGFFVYLSSRNDVKQSTNLIQL